MGRAKSGVNLSILLFQLIEMQTAFEQNGISREEINTEGQALLAWPSAVILRV